MCPLVQFHFVIFYEKFAVITKEIGKAQKQYRVELPLGITRGDSVCMLQLLEIVKLLLERQKQP